MVKANVRAAESRLLQAVRDGDARIGERLHDPDLPTGYLNSHGGELIALAQGHWHYAMMEVLRAELSAATAVDERAVNLANEFERSVADARRAAAISAAPRVREPEPTAGGPRVIDPLRRMLAEDSDGGSGWESHRSGVRLLIYIVPIKRRSKLILLLHGHKA